MSRKSPPEKNGYANVSIAKEHIIICELSGYITGAIAAEAIAKTKEYVRELQAKSIEPKLLIDIHNVTHQTSEARTLAKQLGDIGLKRIAVSGGNKALTMTGQYIANAGGMGKYTRFFRIKSQALHWLHQKQRSTYTGTFFGKIIALLSISVAVLAIVGWLTNNLFLSAFFPTFKPINPVLAITLALFACTIFLLPHKNKHYIRFAISAIALWGIGFGALVLVRYFIGFDIGIDQLLFKSSLASVPFGGSVAPVAAINIILLGFMLLILLTKQSSRWIQYAFHTCSTLLFLLTVAVLAGYGFNVARLYEKSLFTPLALNGAILIILINHALQDFSQPRPFFAKARSLLHQFWQPLAVFVLIMALVGIAYQRTNQDLKNTELNRINESYNSAERAIENRLFTYGNALHGFKAFFESSSVVTADEFKTFLERSQLSENFPGFTSITYVKALKPNEKSAFETLIRKQESANPDYKDFTIRPLDNSENIYAVTYISSKTANPTSLGYNLHTDSTRRLTYETARDTGQATASGPVNLNITRGPEAPLLPGFFISIPIYSKQVKSLEERRQYISGFVNAVFQDSSLFADIFSSLTISQTRFVITDTATGTVKYDSDPSDAKGYILKKESDLMVSDQRWNISMYAGKNFGSTQAEQSLPPLVFYGGLALAVLAMSIMVGQARRRSQAVQLANSMTADLNNERNLAVTNQQKDEAVLASIGDAVFAVDTNEHITVFNSAAERLTGYSKAEALGKPYRTILKFINRKTERLADHFISKALQGHLTSMEMDTVVVTKSGKHISVADSAAPIYGAQGKLQGAIIVFRDITKELELDRAKTEFVSLASHQLRTPLAAIGWYSELLLEEDAGKLPKAQKQYIHEIYEGNQRMIELVNSLLDVSRLEVGKLSNEPSNVRVQTVIESLEKELKTTIIAKSLVLKKTIEQTIGSLYADPKLLRMIVQNLLSNAVKYTPDKGTVTITYRKATPQDIEDANMHTSQDAVFFSVKDTGYGIPKHQQNKIFQKLFRADNVRVLDVEGTGLGLYIVKQAAQKLGGDIWFTSEENKGSIFSVVLPMKSEPTKK